jgi:NDP-sugar pyrophosphorylase family protein
MQFQPVNKKFQPDESHYFFCRTWNPGEGITEFVVNVHHFPELIIKFLKTNNFGVNIQVSDEREKLLETGGALKKAAALLEGDVDPLLMYNVDVMSNIDISSLLLEHLHSGALATLVVRNRETRRYFRFDKEKRLVGWINRGTGERIISIPEHFDIATEMAFSGIHIANPEIFRLMPKEERFSMTDLYLSLAKEYLIKGFFDNSPFWLDVGKPEALKEARKMFM